MSPIRLCPDILPSCRPFAISPYARLLAGIGGLSTIKPPKVPAEAGCCSIASQRVVRGAEVRYPLPGFGHLWGTMLFVFAYRLSPKSARNLAASFVCQSETGSSLPKKNRNTGGSSMNFSPPTKARFS